MPLVFEPRPETAALVELFAAAAPGELLSFSQLSAAAGVDDIRPLQYLLQSARRIAEREHGAIFANERTRGYRRLRYDQIPAVEQRAADHQRSVARQTINTLTRGVERANDMPVTTQLRVDQALARQGVIARITARGMFRRVEAEPGEPLPPIPEIARRLLDRVRYRPVPKRLRG